MKNNCIKNFDDSQSTKGCSKLLSLLTITTRVASSFLNIFYILENLVIIALVVLNLENKPGGN